MDEIDKMLLHGVVFIMIAIVWFGVFSYYNTIEMNNAKIEVFSNITNTTTNKEIVNLIHEACSDMPWYYGSVSYCEQHLLDIFIVPTK